MHESSLTEDLVTHALAHAREVNAHRISRIKVTIGALSDATPESIRWYFDAMSVGTLAEGAELEFQTAPGIARCEACGGEVEIDQPFAACPACGAMTLQIIGGDAVYLTGLDVDVD